MSKETAYRQIAKGGAEMIDFQDPNDYIGEFYFLRQNRFALAYANHESHVDEGVLIEAVDRMNGIGNPHLEFNFPLATSLSSGHQSGLLTNYYLALKPLMEKHRIHPIEVAREVDKEQYSMEGTVKEYFELMRSPQRGKGVVAFPQARVMSGRVDLATGERKGMIKVENDMLPELIRKSLRRAKKGVAFLPIGIHGTFRIYDPGIYNPSTDQTVPGTAGITTEAWKVLALQRFGIRRKLATAVVGKPFTSEELFAQGVSIEDSEAINTFLMQRSAELIPKDARGYYR